MKIKISEPVVIALCAVAGIAGLIAQAPDATLSNSWRMNRWGSGIGRVNLQLTRATLTSRWSESRDFEVEDLQGLSRDQLNAVHAEVRFSIERDAGTIVCQGVLVAGVGGGDFGFSPSRKFVTAMGSLGYDSLSPNQLFSMAISDVSLAFVRQIHQAGLRDVSADELIRLRERHITAESIAEIRKQGYDFMASDFIRLKDHGVQPGFLRDLKDSGYNLRAEEVVRLRDHGVSSSFVRGLAMSKRRFTADEVVQMRDHGVSSEFAADVYRTGYDLEPGQLIRLRDHGINFEYLRTLKESAHLFPPEDIIRMHDNGVPAAFPKELAACGYDNLSAHDMIRLRQNGVDSAYIARLESSGMKRLTPDQIIKLKQHGVD